MVVTRAAIYFLIVFAAGFALGIVRVLLLLPIAGERWAELAEAPFMLLAIVLSARFVVSRFPADQPGSFLVSGFAALAMLLAVEFTVVLWLRGLSIAQYVQERDPVSGTVYVALLAVFAVMPWLLARRRATAWRQHRD